MRKKSVPIVRASLEPDGKLRRSGRKRGKGAVIRGRFERRRAESAAAFAPDKDAPKLTKRQLGELKPAVADDIDVAAIRRRLRLSQAVFASHFRINLSTLQDWEQGRRNPDVTARAYLRVIECAPDTVREALEVS